jgi:thiamine pyrophosphokinase
MLKRVLVIAGGEAEHHLPAGDFDLAIAADSGLDQAGRLGIEVDVVIGDLDSVSRAALAEARGAGVPIEAHPPEKDAVDLELALDAAVARGASEIHVLGGGGGRLDLASSTLHLLANCATKVKAIEATVGGWRVRPLVSGMAWVGEGDKGELISLQPMGGDCAGVTTSGLVFPLKGERLEWGSSRGMSNRFVGGPASVAVDRGTLLLMRPPPDQLAP